MVVASLTRELACVCCFYMGSCERFICHMKVFFVLETLINNTREDYHLALYRSSMLKDFPLEMRSIMFMLPRSNLTDLDAM